MKAALSSWGPELNELKQEGERAEEDFNVFLGRDGRGQSLREVQLIRQKLPTNYASRKSSLSTYHLLAWCKESEVKRWGCQNPVLEVREKDREAGWCGVLDLWESRDTERSVKALAKKGYLRWTWKTEERFASQRSEGSEGGRYCIYRSVGEGQNMVLFERPWWRLQTWVQWGLEGWLAGIMCRQETQEKLRFEMKVWSKPTVVKGRAWTHFCTSLGASKAVGMRWMERLKMTQRSLAQATEWMGYTQYFAQEYEWSRPWFTMPPTSKAQHIFQTQFGSRVQMGQDLDLPLTSQGDNFNLEKCDKIAKSTKTSYIHWEVRGMILFLLQH